MERSSKAAALPRQKLKPMTTTKKQKKTVKRVRCWVNVGSHGGIFHFWAGPVAERYPYLMHVYHKKVAPHLKQAVIEYKV